MNDVARPPQPFPAAVQKQCDGGCSRVCARVSTCVCLHGSYARVYVHMCACVCLCVHAGGPPWLQLALSVLPTLQTTPPRPLSSSLHTLGGDISRPSVSPASALQQVRQAARGACVFHVSAAGRPMA